MLTLGIVDRHPVIRMGLEEFIKEKFNGIEVISANSISEFDMFNKPASVKIIILGFSDEPVSKCFELINQCGILYPSSTLVFYDENRDPYTVKRFISHGIKGYIRKTDGLLDVFNCIEAVIQGQFYYSNGFKESVFQYMMNDLSTYHKAKRLPKSVLTNKEHDIAGYLCEGLSTSEIAYKVNLNCSTISSYKNKILRKMRISNIVELLQVYPNIIAKQV